MFFLPGVGVLCACTNPGANLDGVRASYGVQIVERLSDSIPPSPHRIIALRAGGLLAGGQMWAGEPRQNPRAAMFSGATEPLSVRGLVGGIELRTGEHDYIGLVG